jgi:hypothetical protein
MTFQNAKVGSTSVQTVAFASSAGVQGKVSAEVFGKSKADTLLAKNPPAKSNAAPVLLPNLNVPILSDPTKGATFIPYGTNPLITGDQSKRGYYLPASNGQPYKPNSVGFETSKSKDGVAKTTIIINGQIFATVETRKTGNKLLDGVNDIATGLYTGGLIFGVEAFVGASNALPAAGKAGNYAVQYTNTQLRDAQAKPLQVVKTLVNDGANSVAGIISAIVHIPANIISNFIDNYQKMVPTHGSVQALTAAFTKSGLDAYTTVQGAKTILDISKGLSKLPKGKAPSPSVIDPVNHRLRANGINAKGQKRLPPARTNTPPKLLAPAGGVKPQKLLAPAKVSYSETSITPQQIWQGQAGAGVPVAKPSAKKPVPPKATPSPVPATPEQVSLSTANLNPNNPISQARFVSEAFTKGDALTKTQAGLRQAQSVIDAAEKARAKGNIGSFDAKTANEVVANLKAQLKQAKANLAQNSSSTPSRSIADQNAIDANNGGFQPQGNPRQRTYNQPQQADGGDGMGGKRAQQPQQPQPLPEFAEPPEVKQTGLDVTQKPNTPPPISAPGGKPGVPSKISPTIQKVLNALKNANINANPETLLMRNINGEDHISGKRKSGEKFEAIIGKDGKVTVESATAAGQRRVNTNPDGDSSASGNTNGDSNNIDSVSQRSNSFKLIERAFGQPTNFFKLNETSLKKTLDRILNLPAHEVGELSSNSKERLKSFLNSAKDSFPSSVKQINMALEILKIPERILTDMTPQQIVHSIYSEVPFGQKVIFVTSDRNAKNHYRNMPSNSFVFVTSDVPNDNLVKSFAKFVSDNKIDLNRVSLLVSDGTAGTRDSTLFLTQGINTVKSRKSAGVKPANYQVMSMYTQATDPTVQLYITHGQHYVRLDSPKVVTVKDPSTKQDVTIPINYEFKDTSKAGSTGLYPTKVWYSYSAFKALTPAKQNEMIASGLADLSARYSTTLGTLGLGKDGNGKFIFKNLDAIKYVKDNHPELHHLLQKIKNTPPSQWLKADYEKYINLVHSYGRMGFDGPPINGDDHGWYDAYHAMVAQLKAEGYDVSHKPHGLSVFDGVRNISFINQKATGSKRFYDEFRAIASSEAFAGVNSVENMQKFGLTRQTVRTIFEIMLKSPNIYANKETNWTVEYLKAAKNDAERIRRMDQIIDATFGKKIDQVVLKRTVKPPVSSSIVPVR